MKFFTVERYPMELFRVNQTPGPTTIQSVDFDSSDPTTIGCNNSSRFHFMVIKGLGTKSPNIISTSYWLRAKDGISSNGLESEAVQLSGEELQVCEASIKAVRKSQCSLGEQSVWRVSKEALRAACTIISNDECKDSNDLTV